MVRNVLFKLAFCFVSFGAGLAWGIAAEASAAGIPLTQIFAG